MPLPAVAPKKRGRPKKLDYDPNDMDVRAIGAVDMHIAGKTYREIAEALECPLSAAHAAVERGMARLAEKNAQKAEHRRAVTDVRLERLFEVFYQKALMTGDVKAGQLALRITQQRSQMWGTNAPSRLSINVGSLDNDELLRETAELAARLAPALAGVRASWPEGAAGVIDADSREVAILPACTDTEAETVY